MKRQSLKKLLKLVNKSLAYESARAVRPAGLLYVTRTDLLTLAAGNIQDAIDIKREKR